MGISTSYDMLRWRIAQISNNEEERERFTELVTLYFEGKLSLHALPDELALAVQEWETDNMR